MEIRCISDERALLGESPVWSSKESAIYWTTTEAENHPDAANHLNLTYQHCTAIISFVLGVKDENGYSIRCVKD